MDEIPLGAQIWDRVSVTRIPITDVTITFPSNNSEVEHVVFVEGTSQKIPSDQEICVIVYEPFFENGNYFPMPKGVTVDQNGDWVAETTIGEDANIGEDFHIIAVLADQNARTLLMNTLKMIGLTITLG